ncbi:hypothetical protein OESDEN_13710 [Oesophagostomum dentatum]|uniref:Uncharacterized protein n=1 Tax=Oesophagostomum dentatum TaxID=61180 RepID=A0A0B1SSP3_OESDE|nr:hypothetical protein OESDEN_13710 [Oesophagostomum dentatum]
MSNSNFKRFQYELNGNIIGSKTFRVQYEAVSLSSKAMKSYVLAGLDRLLMDDFFVDATARRAPKLETAVMSATVAAFIRKDFR